MIRIRPATLCDAPALPGVERSSDAIFRHWAGLEWIADDDVQSEERHRALIADGVAFVAELAGYGIAAFLNGTVTPDALHLWQVAVHRDRQRRGLGRQLIDAAQRHAVDHGIPCLTLTTFRTVPWNEPYYQRLGFITLDDRQLGPRLRAVLDAEKQAGLPPCTALRHEENALTVTCRAPAPESMETADKIDVTNNSPDKCLNGL